MAKLNLGSREWLAVGGWTTTQWVVVTDIRKLFNISVTTSSGTSEAEASNSYIPLPSPWGGQEDCPPSQTEVIWSTLKPNKIYLAQDHMFL